MPLSEHLVEEITQDTAMADQGLAPIEQIPLRLQIADRIRKAIVSGKLRPGTVIVETALAEQMNVSRAPIREAIQILEADGLVETAAYKGKRVKPLTAREVTETYEMRQVYEVVAVRCGNPATRWQLRQPSKTATVWWRRMNDSTGC
jgi:DNA-binding GntR family transcriptional regulator